MKIFNAFFSLAPLDMIMLIGLILAICSTSFAIFLGLQADKIARSALKIVGELKARFFEDQEKQEKKIRNLFGYKMRKKGKYKLHTNTPDKNATPNSTKNGNFPSSRGP